MQGDTVSGVLGFVDVVVVATCCGVDDWVAKLCGAEWSQQIGECLVRGTNNNSCKLFWCQSKLEKESGDAQDMAREVWLIEK